MLIIPALAFASSAIFALIVTPAVRRIALHNKWVDLPGERKIHKKPVPLLGGLAIIFAFFLSYLFYGAFGEAPARGNLPLLFGSLMVIGLGLWDFFRGTQPYVKMGILFLIGFLVSVSGQTVMISRNLFINLIFSTFWIAGITNAFNYLDNMDGLSASLAMVSAFCFCAVALLTGQPALALIALMLAGACAGFLRYNFHPASIFMGDIGSYFIGFILAVIGSSLVLPGLWHGAFNFAYIIPILMLGVPIFDTLLVTSMRPLANRRIVQAGKDHSSHRIHRLGFSQKATVLILNGIQVVLGACAIILLRSNREQFAAIIIVVSVMVVYLWLFLAKVKVYA